MEQQWKRKIIRSVAVDSYTPLSEMGLEGHEIKRVWTILDEKAMFEPIKFDDNTGEKYENPIPRTLENVVLRHHYTVFLEDKLHDWNIYEDKFKYYTRVAERGEKLDLLIEYT